MNPANDEPQGTSILPEKKNYLDHMINLGACLYRREYKYLVFNPTNKIKNLFIEIWCSYFSFQVKEAQVAWSGA